MITPAGPMERNCTGEEAPTLMNTAGRDCFSNEVSPVFSGVEALCYWSSASAVTNPAFAL